MDSSSDLKTIGAQAVNGLQDFSSDPALCEQTDQKTEIRGGDFEISVLGKRQLPKTGGVQ